MSAVMLSVFLFAQSVVAQTELAPEPGALAEVDRYDLKLREAFSEAYDKDVVLRALLLPSFSPETALFVDENSRVVTLTPKETSIWSHEHRELVREGSIKITDLNGRRIPPDEESNDVKRIPEKIGEIGMIKRSRAITPELLKTVCEVWEDALIHSTHAQENDVSLDGVRWHYSAWVRGRGVLSGTVSSPAKGTIPSALNAVLAAMIDYASKEANESHIESALWNYKIATKSRAGGMAKISIEKPPVVIPVAMSVLISDSTILPEFTADNISLGVALQRLTAESAKWGKIQDDEGIKFSADKDLNELKVTYHAENESMKSICEALAEQTGADLDFKDAEIIIQKRQDMIKHGGANQPAILPMDDKDSGDKTSPEAEGRPR